MPLLTPEQRDQLLANRCRSRRDPAFDPRPVAA
jgi:hypothetical protein